MIYKKTTKKYKCGHPKVGVRCVICKAEYNRRWMQALPFQKKVEYAKKAGEKYQNLDPEAKAEYIRKVRQRKEKKDASNTDK